PVLVGDAGVGKTAIAEGLALRIVRNEVPSFLHDRRLLSLDIASVVAGTKFRGDFEDRMKRIIKEIRADSSVIIFMDEMHTMMGAGAAEGAIDAANILKPFLARGEVQCIGATTGKEYKKHIEKDPALERRFQKIIVHETDIPQTIQILKGIASRYEEHHHVRYSEDAIISAVTLSKRYIHDRSLPDKAIDCIDEAGARQRIQGEKMPPEIKSMNDEVDRLQEEKIRLVNAQNFEQAAVVRDLINEKKSEIEKKNGEWKKHEGKYSLIVDRQSILSVVQDWTGIQIADSRKDDERFLMMEDFFHTHIIGQDEASDIVARALRRNRSGIRKGSRPIASFLFVGPTGVGKTEFAKVIAEFLFYDRDALIRMDMSEYMEKHAVARLIGSPPGYVGHDDGGQLTERVRKKPYSVILFDEIEKSHADFANILLQILEEGELTDGMGSRVSFKDTVIIMTSNIGNTRFDRTSSIGFGDEHSKISERGKQITSEVKKIFNPELINRIDEIVTFNNLGRDEIKKIVGIHLEDLAGRLEGKRISLIVDDAVLSYLEERSFSTEWGARQVRRTIEKEIEDRIATHILQEPLSGSCTITISLTDGEIVLSRVRAKKKSKRKVAAGLMNG
ncbi:MAG TPA: ATP-dependent Clp protease ATP-binding subunit, partial [Spirochaetota bacterium]